jgi:hypothetical protein
MISIRSIGVALGMVLRPMVDTLPKALLGILLLAGNAAADSAAGTEDETTQADPTSAVEDERTRTLPFYRSWFEQQGIELPLPFGAGFMGIFMERDIEVTDVTVQFLDRPPESISDRADFEVSNRTRSASARFDAWVLPFLNVYVLAWQAYTDTSLRSNFVIDRPIGPPIEVEISEDTAVDGPMLGLGFTAVFGGDFWFAMADANYTIAEMDLFDEEIRAWLYSGRLGWHGSTRWGLVRAWGGLFYMDSERTLTITEQLAIIGPTEVRVTQRPVDPLTYQLGASVTIARHWDLLIEAGTNFDDAKMLVLSASYRF